MSLGASVFLTSIGNFRYIGLQRHEKLNPHFKAIWCKILSSKIRETTTKSEKPPQCYCHKLVGGQIKTRGPGALMICLVSCQIGIS